MHEKGFRKALTNVVNRYARKRHLLERRRTRTLRVKTSAKADRHRVGASHSPQFEGQTRGIRQCVHPLHG